MSQLADPLSTDPGLKSGISVQELISTSHTRGKIMQVGNEWSNILPKSLQAGKNPPPFVLRF